MIGLTRKNSSRGFTLIEVIVTLGVFTIAALMAVNLFVIFVQQQRRTVVQQELQNDTRSAMEQIAQDVREGNIDYAFYETEFASTLKKLFTPLNGKDNNPGLEYLSLRSSTNEQIQYRLNGAILQRSQGAVPSWQDITPASLEVQSFTIFISPSENPFAGKSYVQCGHDASGSSATSDFTIAPCPWGTICENQSTSNTCQYARGSDTVTGAFCYCYPQTFGTVAPLHPTVTYSIKVKRQTAQQVVQQTFQTTVASRTFSSVERLNNYAP